MELIGGDPDLKNNPVQSLVKLAAKKKDAISMDFRIQSPSRVYIFLSKQKREKMCTRNFPPNPCGMIFLRIM